MSYLALFFFFLIVYTYLLYPMLIFLLGRVRNKKVYKKEIFPSVCLMIAAYNEEKEIETKIKNSLDLDYPKELLRIIVVSDASSDQTDLIVKRYEQQGIDLKRVEGRVGKTQARNLALREVDSDIIVFSDATTLYEKDIIKRMVANFADPEVGMVCAKLEYLRPEQGDMATGQALFWKIECAMKKAQTNLGTLTGSLGCASAFRRECYVELPPEVIEDFTEPLMIIQNGKRVVFEEKAICYEYATEGSSQEWRMRVRTICGGMHGLRYAKKVLNPIKYPVASFQLISHKVLRWLAGPNAIFCLLFTSLAIGFGESGTFLKLMLAAQLVFFLTVFVAIAIEKVPEIKKIVSIGKYFFILNAASIVALYKTIALPAQTTWETDRGGSNGSLDR